MAIWHLDIRYIFLNPHESQSRIYDSTLRGHFIVSVLTYRYNDIYLYQSDMKHADMPSGDMEAGSIANQQDYDACEEDTIHFLRRV